MGNHTNTGFFFARSGRNWMRKKLNFLTETQFFAETEPEILEKLNFFAIFSYTLSQNAQSSIAMCWYVWYGRIKYCGVWHGSIKNISNSENSIIFRKLNGILLWNSIFRLKTQFFSGKNSIKKRWNSIFGYILSKSKFKNRAKKKPELVL